MYVVAYLMFLWLVHTGVKVEVDKKSTATFCRLRFQRQCGRDFMGSCVACSPTTAQLWGIKTYFSVYFL